MSLTIGVTGGIGSGKSTICKIFSILGVPVFDADMVARSLTVNNTNIQNGLINLFGKEIYHPDGKLNRKMLAGYIFSNDEMLEAVNKIIHPVVRNEFFKWKEIQSASYIVHEAAILFESGFYKLMDYTILVTAPEETRIARVTARDGSTPEMVRLRMSNQWDDEKKRKLATFELINDNKSLLIPQILNIDKNIKKYGKIW